MIASLITQAWMIYMTLQILMCCTWKIPERAPLLVQTQGGSHVERMQVCNWTLQFHLAYGMKALIAKEGATKTVSHRSLVQIHCI